MEKTEPTYETYTKPNWLRRNWIETLTIFCGIVSINLILIANAYRETGTVNPETAG